MSWRPNGIGLVKPNHYGEMLRTVWVNRKNLRYGWKVLTQGACDGCALGVAGLHDWGQDGIHLCSTRLRLLEFNTADVMNADALADVASLAHLDGAGLRDLGRLGYPLRRRKGDAGFSVITWEEALSAIADSINATTPDRVGVYLTSR
ncbi:MAG: formate dehydrogenase, partial [Ilumatobacteraceae bacterium]